MSHGNWRDDEIYRDHFEPGSGAAPGIRVQGVYVCSNCDNKLFESGSKFAHKSPWPSFSQTVHGKSVKKEPEPNKPKALRIYCGKCESRLGHEFLGEGPKGKSRF